MASDDGYRLNMFCSTCDDETTHVVNEYPERRRSKAECEACGRTTSGRMTIIGGGADGE